MAAENYKMAANSDNVPDVTGIILAGGRSSRLGRDKAFETLHNRRIIDLISDVLSRVCISCIIVTSAERYNNFVNAGLSETVITDDLPGKSSIGGVYTGIRAMKTQYGIVVACDMPFLNESLLKYMIALTPKYDAVVPRIDGYLETLHAVYSKNCVNTLKASIDAGSLSLWRVLKSANTRIIEEDEYNRLDPMHFSYFNVNTADDLVKAARMFNEMNSGTASNTEYETAQGM